MEDFQSKYSGEQIEELLDQVANGNQGSASVSGEVLIFSSSSASIENNTLIL